MCEKVFGHLKMVAFPSKVEFLHAFEEAKALGAVAAAAGGALAGWGVYDAHAQLDRLGVLRARHPRTGDALWRVSDVNRDYAFAPTYPAALVLPALLGDEIGRAHV